MNLPSSKTPTFDQSISWASESKRIEGDYTLIYLGVGVFVTLIFLIVMLIIIFYEDDKKGNNKKRKPSKHNRKTKSDSTEKKAESESDEFTYESVLEELIDGSSEVEYIEEIL